MIFKYLYSACKSTLPLALVYLVSISAFAVEIDLLKDPKANSSIVSKIDLSNGVIPIFTSKDGKWVKVGDPKNGNVGWIESKALSNKADGSFVYQHTVIKKNNGKETIHSVEFGNKAPQSPKNDANYMKMRIEQEKIKQSMQNNMKEIMRDMNKLYHQQMELFYRDWQDFPALPGIELPTNKPEKSLPDAKKVEMPDKK